MNKFEAFLIILILTICAIGSSAASARSVTLNIPDTGCITVRHLSVPGGNAVLNTFDASSFDSVQGPIWNFSGTCNTPPPTDPGAYTLVSVNWLVYPSMPPRMTDVTQFGNVFGRVNPIAPAYGWPYANGATVQLVDNSTKYYRMRVSIPAGSPVSNSHKLTAASYGKSPPTLRARFAIVMPGAPWPVGAGNGCYTPNAAFNDSTVLTVNYHGAPNPYKCSVGNEFDVLMDAIGNGTMALAWN